MTVHTLGLTPALDVVYVLDEVRLGGIHRPPVVLRSAGGKSLNVARALTLLGVPVRAIAPLGGRIGDLVAQLLDEHGVRVDRITSSVETRMCVTASDTTARTLTEFYEPVTAFDVPLAEIAQRTAHVKPGEWLTLSGAVPGAVDPHALADLLAAEVERGVLLAVDVHGPALGTILEGASPRLVKVNRSEAEELTGHDDREDAAAALLARGATVAVVTDGEAGSFALTADGERVSAPPVTRPGLFPVGSGDCYLAGLVAVLDAGGDLAAALDAAAAVAAANAQLPGAAVFDVPPIPSLSPMGV
ncbi:MAG: PfkB family carbohydrate kinase [Leifsonia sp.]